MHIFNITDLELYEDDFLKAKTYYNEMGYLIIDNVLNAETIDELNCFCIESYIY